MTFRSSENSQNCTVALVRTAASHQGREWQVERAQPNGVGVVNAVACTLTELTHRLTLRSLFLAPI